jgi:hypothetical protein
MELGQVVNQFILWNQRKIFLDGLISPQRQRIQLSQTLTSSSTEHALATPAQQAAQQLSSPHTEQEAPQQPPQSPPKDKEAPQLPPPHTEQEASQQPPQSPPKDKEAQQLPSPHTEQEAPQHPPQSPPNDKEAPQLPSPPTETTATKDKKASLVQGMPPPSSSPYDTIYEDLALYKTKPHSDPIDQFFVAMRNLKSSLGTTSKMSTPAQHAETYLRACEIVSYEEDGEVYNREKLLVRPPNLIFMMEHVPKKFVFGKPFLTTAQLLKIPFSLRRLHNWYMMVSSLGMTNITFEISGNAFYSGARIRSIDFEDLWYMNLLVIFCV